MHTQIPRMFLFLALFTGCLLSFTLKGADPVAEITSFSEFNSIDLKALADGKILAERGSVMEFERGIALQTCFIVHSPASDLVKFIPFWDATPHPELGVYQNFCFEQTDEKNFEKLVFDTGKAPVKRLIERCMDANPDKTNLQMDFEEFAQLQSALNSAAKPSSGSSNDPVESLRRFWAHFLANRWQQFQKGGFDALSSYDISKSKFSSGEEIRSVLAEQPRISKRFEGLLAETPWKKGGGWAKPVTYYWTFSDVNKTGNLNLGVIYSKAFTDHWQMIDMTYYTTGDYFASMVFYEIWPVQVDQKEAALVWRFDGVSAPSLAFLKGVDRMFASGIMLQESKKVIRALQQDAAKK